MIVTVVSWFLLHLLIEEGNLVDSDMDGGGGVDFTIKRERFNGSIRRLARRTNSSLKAKSIFVGRLG